MLECDWLLRALIYGLIGCFGSKLSNYNHSQSDRPNRTVKQPIKIMHCMPLANKLQLTSLPQPIKIKENFLPDQIDRCRLKTNMDEINWSNDFYNSDLFFLDSDCLFSTIDLKSFSHFVIGASNNLVIGLSGVQFRGNCARNFNSASRYGLSCFEITQYPIQSFYHYIAWRYNHQHSLLLSDY